MRGFGKCVGLALLLNIVAQAPASAAGFVCELNPKLYLAVDSGGNVLTAIVKKSDSAITVICNLKTDGAVAAQACSAWYSTLLTMRMSSGKALPHFNSSDASNAGHTSCETFNSWETHFPYFMLWQ